MAEGAGNAPTSARADPVFKTGAASLYLPAFQKWSGWRELHSRPPPSEGGRLLLTLHPEIGCQTWTCTKTSGLTGRRATLTPPGNGAADRSSTCIVPLRKRTPHVFGHGSKFEIGQRGRNCTCGPSVPGRACCCYTTRCSPRHAGSTPGTCFHGDAGPTHLEPESRGEIRINGGPEGSCTLNPPADNGALC